MHKRSGEKDGKGSVEPKKVMGCGSVPKKAKTASRTTPDSNPELEDVTIKEEEIDDDEEEEIEEEEEEDMCNVFTHEMDNLECDICFQPFESRVYSCKNGHAACANCCINMERKCPNCNESIGDFRCRATEKILAGMTRPCRFKKHGCTKTVRYTEARNHEEELCSYAPYRCPFDGCAFRGCLLYGHILDAHAPGTSSGMDVHGDMTLTLKKCESFRALMDCDGESVVLLLNRDDVLTGRSLAVVRVCPYPVDEDPEGVEMKKYSITVEGGEPGTLSLTASGTLPFVRRLVGYKPKGFLFVPDDFWGSSGSVTITVRL